jgi:hypothetical protein
MFERIKKHVEERDAIIVELDNYYGYELSSMGAKGVDFFMGEKDEYTYVMAHDGDWEQTQVFVLRTENKVEDEQD